MTGVQTCALPILEELDRLAAKHKTSFNNIVVTMVEDRLEELRQEKEI